MKNLLLSKGFEQLNEDYFVLSLGDISLHVHTKDKLPDVLFVLDYKGYPVNDYWYDTSAGNSPEFILNDAVAFFEHELQVDLERAKNSIAQLPSLKEKLK